MMLDQKQQEIENFSKTVAEAEELLSKLQEEIREKEALLDDLESNDSDSDFQIQNEFDKEIENLIERQNKEISDLQMRHEDEMNQLKLEFEQTLNNAEKWANKHAEIIYQEKVKELNEINQQSTKAKFTLNEATFTKRGPRSIRALDELQKSNSNQIADLETQISELSAIAREEARNAKAEIDECVTSIELRKESQASELRNLQIEASKRSETYKSHIETLKEQFLIEEQTIQNEIDALQARTLNIEGLIDQIGRHHEIQTSSVTSDIETIRRSIGSENTNLRHSYDSNYRSTIRETHNLFRECQKIEEETALLDREMLQLDEENKQLKKDLKKLAFQMNH
ncbi:hypothetical protein TRFO_21651 [Tritrichomonas foetus]|uniref:Kinetoplast-associated protein n=1 Tax=Tritrichomonas foetus TaxID=1144522 RepID=A0A1J4KJ99_9EUKA|nr:hypothetical protein TRFO_21651 [Tritrichomonas foetus]|eukprot:OHT09421.1 hypothetical protein TRFO_21651 [Tritrichomonas foetus]